MLSGTPKVGRHRQSIQGNFGGQAMVRLSTARAIWLSWLGLGRVRWAQPRTRPL
jgi:hypothetical protein